MPKKFLRGLYLLYLALVTVAVVVIGFYAHRALTKYHTERSFAELEIRARLAGEALPEPFVQLGPDTLQHILLQQSWISQTRFTLVSLTGRVLAESDRVAPPAALNTDEDSARSVRQRDELDLETLTFRPEIREALQGSVGRAVRHSTTLERDVIFVAVPLRRNGAVVGAMRAGAPLNALAPNLDNFQFQVLLSMLITVLLAVLLTMWFTRRINRPLVAMKAGAERFAVGDFSRKIELPVSPELAGLADALNQMGTQLGDKIHTITRQRNEQDAILTSLRESVIAVDSNDRILFLNRAAAQLLGVEAERAVGRLLPEVVRNSKMQQFIGRVMNSSGELEDVTVEPGEQVVLQLSGTPLRDANGQTIGALIVINDISKIKRLETIRREFVANVSHELRTPITTIKGFVETLADTGFKDETLVRNFLERIENNTDRLNAIIDDLLSLSRIESEGERGQIVLTPGSLGSVAAAAISNAKARATAAGVTLKLVCDKDFIIPLHSVLLEQAVFNLLDNAIKHSPAGANVTVQIEGDGGQAFVKVIDEGSGIGKEHLPRIFERFYRVDKGRSRQSGGTGLGLAIVKHIVQAHGGYVTVESTEAMGSTFTVALPR